MPAGDAGPLNVLVVEDDDGDALMIEEALAATANPAVMRRVVDGREAVDFLRRQGAHAQAQRPDIILLDLNMPRMDGREVLAEVKTDRSLQSIPVVVLTTSAAAEDVLSSYRHRANAYVTKPIDLVAFETVVQDIDRFYREVAVLPS